MKSLKNFEVWFVTGSQHLYGEATLKKVAEHSNEISHEIDQSPVMPVKVVFKPVLKTPSEILDLCIQANNSLDCVGLILWMHTFSPAKMWINGLKILNKPVVHFHTQYNRDIPWDSIDMDFMNLNQSAHGDRESGFIMSRMRMDRKVIVGHWKELDVVTKLASWSRAACGWNEWQQLKVARLGDNMREVAVTEGDKVEAQVRLGFSVNGYGVGELVNLVGKVSDNEIDNLIDQYIIEYEVPDSAKKQGAKSTSLRESARIEAGLRKFLDIGGFKAFTTTFEDLHGLKQLPGLAVQRLMADGYGFGAEGDWKTSALVRAMKVMSTGLKGGTSFMEDYTYHLNPNGMKVLGAHMLEVCPSIGDGRPSLQVHPLGIGGKEDPARLVFNVPEGAGVNASIMDMGDHFRLLVNPCKVVRPDADLPKLPVARVVWIPEPNLKTSAEAWIYAGGAHHTGFSMAIGAEELENFADIAGMEFLLIDKNTNIREFKKEIRWNDLFYQLRR